MKKYITAGVATLSLAISACIVDNGTSTTTNNNNNTSGVEVFRIEGDLFKPNADVSLVAFNPIQYLTGMPVNAALNATAQGLEKVSSDIEVRLIKIDDSGNPLASKPLATAKTDANGHYVLDVPTTAVNKNSFPSTDLVIESGDFKSGTFLRSFIIVDPANKTATNTVVNLSPISTALVQLIADRNEPLFSLQVLMNDAPDKFSQIQKLIEDNTKNINYDRVPLASAVTNTLSSLKASPTLNGELNSLLGRVVSGTVMAPNSLVAYQQPLSITTFLMPPAAALTGIQPVGPDITVNLSEMDDKGEFIGQPQVSTRTRSDGRYSFLLPENRSPASSLIAHVSSGNSLMRAFVAGTANLNISPLTEITVRTVLNNGKLLNQAQVPLSQFSPVELISILDNVQKSTATTDITGVNGIGNVVRVLEPVAQSSSEVLNSMKSTAGLPAPVVTTIPPATAADTVTLTGTASPGATVKVEGGVSPVQQTLGSGESSFSLTVTLKRNTKHSLLVSSIIGAEASLPTVVTLRHDTLNPVIDTTKIKANNPVPNPNDARSFQTTIVGSSGAIKDSGRSTVVIIAPKLGNRTSVQTDENGSFTAVLTSEAGDTLSITAVDEANNQANATVVVGVPGPGITEVSPSNAFPGDILTIRGAGYSTTKNNNIVSFTSPSNTITAFPETVDTNLGILTVKVPSGLVSDFFSSPATVGVKVTTDNLDSNTNRSFALRPEVKEYQQSGISSNGDSDYFLHDSSRNNLLLSTQNSAESKIMSLNLNGDVLNKDIASDVNHESIFRDILLDGNHIFTSNFSISALGRSTSHSSGRPTYRVTKYSTATSGSTIKLSQRVSDSAELNAEPGAMAIHPTNKNLYVAIPKEGKIVKIDFSGSAFGTVSDFTTGLPAPVKDFEFDSNGENMYVSTGENTSIFKLTLNSSGTAPDLVNSNFVTNLGSGSGHLSLDSNNNIFVTNGTGVDRIDTKGTRVNLIPVLIESTALHTFKPQTTVGLALINNALYINQLNTASLFKITP